MDWQIVDDKVDDDYTDEMLKVAAKRPQVSKKAIVDKALPYLGLTSQTNFYKVSH